MNNFDRNTRTLIVSFLVAIFALIPLRFIEVGAQQSLLSQTQVLGETVVNVDQEQKTVTEENEAKLEAPYDELETCINKAEVKMVEDEVYKQLRSQNLDKEQIVIILDELKRIEVSACR